MNNLLYAFSGAVAAAGVALTTPAAFAASAKTPKVVVPSAGGECRLPQPYSVAGTKSAQNLADAISLQFQWEQNGGPGVEPVKSYGTGYHGIEDSLWNEGRTLALAQMLDQFGGGSSTEIQQMAEAQIDGVIEKMRGPEEPPLKLVVTGNYKDNICNVKAGPTIKTGNASGFTYTWG